MHERINEDGPKCRALCECGCGNPTPVAGRTTTRDGHIKGQPMRFILGHGRRKRPGPAGRVTSTHGYVTVLTEGRGYVYEHILLAEKALGRALPRGADVHHVDENKANNVRGNLVLCDSRAYHMLLHRRARALRASGNANSLLCRSCRQWDAPERIKTVFRSNGYPVNYHPACNTADSAKNRKQTEVS